MRGRPERDRQENKEYIGALREIRKEPQSGFFARIPARLKVKLDVHIATTGQSQSEWLIEVIDKL